MDIFDIKDINIEIAASVRELIDSHHCSQKSAMAFNKSLVT